MILPLMMCTYTMESVSTGIKSMPKYKLKMTNENKLPVLILSKIKKLHKLT